MIKLTAVTILVLVPLLFGIFMIPVLDFIEKVISRQFGRNRDKYE